MPRKHRENEDFSTFPKAGRPAFCSQNKSQREGERVRERERERERDKLEPITVTLP